MLLMKKLDRNEAAVKIEVTIVIVRQPCFSTKYVIGKPGLNRDTQNVVKNF